MLLCPTSAVGGPAYGWELRGNKAIKNGKSTLKGWKDYMRKKDERQGALYISLRPSMARARVAGSAYSRLEPTGRPMPEPGNSGPGIKI